jgi:predicted O-methyltransferase YrrM
LAAPSSDIAPDAELRGDDADRVGHSLGNLIEIVFPLLDAVAARSVVEIGSYAGDLTRLILGWAAGAEARVLAVDPDPRPELIELGEHHEELELIRKTSHEALREIAVPDAVIIDGDHNYYTVCEELRLINERARGGIPLILLHDVCWPHGRRDAYYAPLRIPAEYRRSAARNVRLFPGDQGIAEGGLPYPWAAEREGGPRNGVLTAVEDFVEGREGLRLAIVPAFFGLGVLWRHDAPWAGEVAEILDQWDRNPVLARMEANRVLHIATEHAQVGELIPLQERTRIQEDVLRLMLGSSAFAWAERLSRLRKGGRPAFSRELVRRALGDVEPR